ncbi:MAG: hypothetical protein FJ098_12650, partial [Deltaproteobacteria bacterium]|nr:hypothetical protein [Deltaproteobacteria bacterium]
EGEGLDPVLDSENPPLLVIWRWNVLHEGEFRALADLIADQTFLMVLYAADEEKKARSCCKAWPGPSVRLSWPVDFDALCAALAKVLDDGGLGRESSAVAEVTGDVIIPPALLEEPAAPTEPPQSSTPGEEAIDDFRDGEATLVTSSPQRLARENARLKSQVTQLKERIEESLARQRDMVRALKAAEASGPAPEIERHSRENLRLKERLQALEKRLEGSENDRREAIRELSQARTERKELARRVDELEKEGQELRDALEESSVRLDTAEGREDRIQSLEIAREEMAREIKQLRGVSESLRRELEQVSESKAAVILDLQRTRSELARAQDERDAAQEATRTGERALAERSALLVRLNAALARTVEKADHLQARVVELEKEQDSGAASAAALREEASGLQREVEGLRRDREALTRSLSDAAAAAQETRVELEALSGLSAELAAARVRVEELEQEAAVREKARAESARQLAARVEELESERRELEQLLTESEADWGREREQLRTARETAEAERLALAGTLETLRHECGETRARLGGMQAELEEARRRAEETALELREALDSQEAWENERGSLLKARRDAEELLESQRREVAAQGGRMEDLRGDLAAAEEMNSELEVRFNEALGRGRDAEAALTRATGIADERGSRIAALEAELAARDEALATRDSAAAVRDAELQARDAELRARDAELQARDAALEELRRSVASLEVELGARDEGIGVLKARVVELEAALAVRDEAIAGRDAAVANLEATLSARNAAVEELRDSLSRVEAGPA